MTDDRQKAVFSVTGQLSLDAFQPKEVQTYQLAEETIRAVIRSNSLGEEFITCQKGKTDSSYWSITYFGALIARIHFGKKVSYFSVDVAAKEQLEQSGIRYDMIKSDQDFVRILLQEPEDILPCLDVVASATQRVLDNIPKEFDCCSWVEACSDARRCVQPNDGLRIGCGYRKILASGRVFYGKNRNVD